MGALVYLCSVSSLLLLLLLLFFLFDNNIREAMERERERERERGGDRLKEAARGP